MARVRGVRSPVPAGKLVGSSVNQGAGAAVFVTPHNPALSQPQAGTSIVVNGNVVSVGPSGVAAGAYAGSTTTFTVNAEGQVTHVSTGGANPITGTITVGLSGDASGSASGSGNNPTVTVPMTLDTVNSNTGQFQGITLNGKGLATAAVQMAATTPPVAGANPTGTTVVTGVMMGLAIAFTPEATGRAMMFIRGQMTNSLSGATTTVIVAYGTGTAPINGAVPVGTFLTSNCINTIDTAGDLRSFVAMGMVTGLTPGTAYWIDAVLETGNVAGTATISKVGVWAHEF